MHSWLMIPGLSRQVLLSGVLVVLASNASAQWVQTSGPKEGTARTLLAVPNASGGTNLFAGQLYIWRTSDNGATWTRFQQGLTDPSPGALLALPNGTGGNDVLVGTSAGVFRSINDGVSWNPINSGIANQSISALALGSNGSGGTNLYAGAGLVTGKVFRSVDNGASWTETSTGLPVGQTGVSALITSASGTVLAGTGMGIYRSTNFGASWTQVFNLYGLSFAKHGSTLYAGTSNGVYKSTNDGASWTPINNGMTFNWVYAMAAIPNGTGLVLFANMMRSTDNGATWVPASNGIPNPAIHAIAFVPNPGGSTDLYAATNDGVYRSTNLGGSWTHASFIASSTEGLEVTPSGAVLAGTQGQHIFRSNDAGGTWTNVQGASVLDFAVNLNGTSGVSLFSGGVDTGVLRSTDDGATWSDANIGIDDLEINSVAVVPNGSGGSNILAGSYSGIYRSTNDGAWWEHIDPRQMPLDWAVIPNGSGGYKIFGGGHGGVWQSTDYGATWTSAGLSELVQGMATTSNGAYVFAGGDPFGVYRSADAGASWTLVNNGLTDLRIFALLSSGGSNLFAAGAGGVYLSTDNGANWTSVGSGLTTGVFSLALSPDRSTLYAGTTGFGVWKRPVSEMLPVLAVDPGVEHPGLELGINHPNPFGASTTIQYSLPSTTSVRLVVYDVMGRAVRTLADGIHPAGATRLVWDGRDERGASVRPGIYVYRLDAAGTTLTRRMALVR